MTARRAELRFFADESVLGLGKVLTPARHDFVHAGHPMIPEVPLGALDPVWIPEIAARNLTVIARDRRIRSKPGELALLKLHGLRVFWIAGKKDLATWDYLVLTVRHWNAIEKTCATRGPGPWFMSINEANIREIPLK